MNAETGLCVRKLINSGGLETRPCNNDHNKVKHIDYGEDIFGLSMIAMEVDVFLQRL